MLKKTNMIYYVCNDTMKEETLSKIRDITENELYFMPDGTFSIKLGNNGIYRYYTRKSHKNSLILSYSGKSTDINIEVIENNKLLSKYRKLEENNIYKYINSSDNFLSILFTKKNVDEIIRKVKEYEDKLGIYYFTHDDNRIILRGMDNDEYIIERGNYVIFDEEDYSMCVCDSKKIYKKWFVEIEK